MLVRVHAAHRPFVLVPAMLRISNALQVSEGEKNTRGTLHAEVEALNIARFAACCILLFEYIHTIYACQKVARCEQRTDRHFDFHNLAVPD